MHHCFVSIATAYDINIIIVFESTNPTKYLENFKWTALLAYYLKRLTLQCEDNQKTSELRLGTYVTDARLEPLNLGLQG